MKPEIARHIVENGGLLAKDSVLMLLDYVESADRKIAQLVTDRQRFKELAQSNLLRAEAAEEELAAIKGDQQPVAWRWRWSDDEKGCWRYTDEQRQTRGSVTAQPLYFHAAAPAAVLPVIVLKDGSLKSDGNIWYKSETVVQLIRATGLEVKR